MNLAGQKVVVVGLAQTGVAVARFCAQRGAHVVITDAKPADALHAQIAQVQDIAELELGGHIRATFTEADAVVVSPGVPELSEMRAAHAAGVPVMAEIELAYRFLDPEVTLIAITGTNGKSTTTALTGALCAASQTPTFCGGNLGNHPLIEAVDHSANQPGGLIVAEVAGFMLETCTSFRPHVSVCLNVTEDHLDRYGTMAVYASMKTRIYQWQNENDFAIGNANCPWVMRGLRSTKATQLVFDSKNEVEAGAFLTPHHRELVVRLPGRSEEVYSTDEIPLVGTHNLENAMVAFLAARLANVSPTVIRTAVGEFHPPRHRMEHVAELNGVVYLDDSKGTNVAAVAASLHGFPHPVVLIAGGVDKGGSYEPLFDAADGVLRGLVLIGEAKSIIRQAACDYGVTYPVIDAKDMNEAVTHATEIAQPGDRVLLSPACSSYDMYKNFAERGQAFRRAVEAFPLRTP